MPPSTLAKTSPTSPSEDLFAWVLELLSIFQIAACPTARRVNLGDGQYNVTALPEWLDQQSQHQRRAPRGTVDAIAENAKA